MGFIFQTTRKTDTAQGESTQSRFVLLVPVAGSRLGDVDGQMFGQALFHTVQHSRKVVEVVANHTCVRRQAIDLGKEQLGLVLDKSLGSTLLRSLFPGKPPPRFHLIAEAEWIVAELGVKTVILGIVFERVVSLEDGVAASVLRLLLHSGVGLALLSGLAENSIILIVVFEDLRR